MGRGPGKRLSAGSRGVLVHTGIEVEDDAVSVCPVGALLEKRSRLRGPVGRRKYDSSPIGFDIEQGTKRVGSEARSLAATDE